MAGFQSVGVGLELSTMCVFSLLPEKSPSTKTSTMKPIEEGMEDDVFEEDETSSPSNSPQIPEISAVDVDEDVKEWNRIDWQQKQSSSVL